MAENAALLQAFENAEAEYHRNPCAEAAQASETARAAILSTLARGADAEHMLSVVTADYANEKAARAACEAAILEYNEVLRSAASIAVREFGEPQTTNWLAFAKRAKGALEKHHATWLAIFRETPAQQEIARSLKAHEAEDLRHRAASAEYQNLNIRNERD